MTIDPRAGATEGAMTEVSMELSARGIESHRFSTSLRGYDKDEVAAFLAEVGAHVGRLDEQLAIAHARATRAQEELDSLHDVLDRRLAEAQAARAAIVEKAEHEAEEILAAAARGEGPDTAGAARTAAAIISEAEVKAAMRIEQAEAEVAAAQLEAETIVRKAEATADLRLAEADRALDEAHGRAKSVRTETERNRSEIENHLAEVRKILMAARAGGTDDLEAGSVILTKGTDVIIDLRAVPSRVDEPAS